MQTLEEKYLPYPDPGSSEELKARSQDLAKFVRALRRECVALHRRIEAIQSLKEGLERRRGVTEVRSLDREGREIEIEFMGKLIARIYIGTNGTIEKVIVRHDMKEGSSLKAKVIEMKILDGDGRIESLLLRICELV